jgi:hypothetical protein
MNWRTPKINASPQLTKQRTEKAYKDAGHTVRQRNEDVVHYQSDRSSEVVSVNYDRVYTRETAVGAAWMPSGGDRAQQCLIWRSWLRNPSHVLQQHLQASTQRMNAAETRSRSKTACECRPMRRTPLKSSYALTLYSIRCHNQDLCNQ